MSSQTLARGLGLAALCSMLALAPLDAQDQEQFPIVERIEIEQNQFLQKETLLFYVSTKAGDRYDERRLREDFHRLWDTGFLDDLVLEVAEGLKGKLVRFLVKERRRVQIVDYRGSKELSNSAIEDKLKEKENQIRIDTFYDIAKCRRAEQIIREMLTEKGRAFATVKHDAKNVGGAGVQVSFVIDDGPRTRVKQIEFVGNQVFSSGRLRGAMKKIKQHGIFNLSFITGSSTFTEEKWEEDLKNLQDFYLDRGYVRSSIGRPAISYLDEGEGKGAKKWARIEIPVTEGEQYRVGEVKFEGLTVFPEDAVRPLFKLKTGDTYKESALKQGYEKLRDAYGAQGYFQWTGYTKRSPDQERKVVDLIITMEEDKRYFVGKIRFTGNDTTRDKVIRREVFMNEGDVFNTEALKMSIKRINQLGYFKPMEGVPNLAPSGGADDHLDVTFKVEEQNRNQFTFGGGISGLEGTFLNASFSTANFLGLGETFQVSAQSGARTKNYQIAITEPYFLDRPITAGFDVFRRELVYQSYGGVLGFTRQGTGLSLVFGVPVGRFSRIFTNYSYELVDIRDLQESSQVTADPSIPTDTTPVQLNPFYYGEKGKRTESRFSPSFVHNTVDNPWMPREGVKLSISSEVAGGPLGGTLSFWRPNLEGIAYLPVGKRTAFGFRAEVSWLKSFGDTARVDPRTGRNGLPLYQRFFLGGETQIRGYDIRTVGPLETLPDGQERALGGNKYVLFNVEYYIDLGGPLRAVLFFDAGQAYLEDHAIDLKQLRTSTGVELRFIMPVLNVPFRLIYAYNPNRDSFQPKTAFKFAVGTTF